ncbi:MAG TPA: hypothetical protein ENN84_01125 [Candidatus Marinimicrobia bacterium]|nr:hypothetical protein [Candidatus Neomarinimicrobiota bacterium]
MGIIKILVKTLLGGLALLFILLTSLYLYHTYQLKVEARNFPPLGELVEIKQKKFTFIEKAMETSAWYF